MKKHNLTLFLFFIFSCQTLMANVTGHDQNESFLKGYIYSKLEDRYPNEKIEFDLRDHLIIVYEFPADSNLCDNIRNFLEGFEGYEVAFDKSYNITQECSQNDFMVAENIEEGDWLPELSPFFPTMLAQPHIIGYSAGYRSYDKIFRTSCLPVSIGDQFSLYQFKTERSGRLYFGIEACVWAIFEARAKSLSLINADYYIGLPLTYINKKFSSKLRIFHQSSHLGDEFLLENEKIKRLNPSMEVVDLSVAYDFTDRFTAFAGYSRVIRSDDGFRIKPNGFYYGFNYFIDFFKINLCNLEAIPYIAAYFTNYQDNKWELDSNIAIGYQWDKLYGHKLRVYFEGHEGYSHEGQFSKHKARYLALKVLYGY